MKRRQFLAGIGATSLGVSTAVGTSAFSRTEAKRGVRVNAVPDSDAYLKIDSLSKYADGSEDGTVELFFDGNRFGVTGDGLGLDSVYEFRANNGVFGVTNHGDQKVGFYVTNPTDSDIDVAAFDISAHEIRDESNLIDLAVGEAKAFGIQINTHGATIGEFEEKIVLNADASVV